MNQYSIVYLTLFVAISTALLDTVQVECRRLAAIRRNQNELSNGELEKMGQSRAAGGFMNGPGPSSYFGALWSKGFDPDHWFQGHHAGNFIRVGDELIIMHRDSEDVLSKTDAQVRPENTLHHPNVSWSWNVFEAALLDLTNTSVFNYMYYPAPLEMNPYRVRGDINTYQQIDSYQNVGQSNLGPSKFALYKLKLEWRHLQNWVRPVLEENKNNLGHDCWVQTYSYKPIVGGNPEAIGIRYFTRFQALPIKCDTEGYCELEGTTGKICNNTADKGSPVLCGADMKVTYLVSDYIPDESPSCSIKFRAYHVAYFVEHLKRLMNQSYATRKLNTTCDSQVDETDQMS